MENFQSPTYTHAHTHIKHTYTHHTQSAVLKKRNLSLFAKMYNKETVLENVDKSHMI